MVASVTTIEPADRVVALARTMNTQSPEAEDVLRDSAADCARFGATCLGQALYRHESAFQGVSRAPVWSHLELRYFRDLVPDQIIRELVSKQQPAGIELHRAEVLLTTPKSFVLPRDWQGTAHEPQMRASLEYIEVEPACLGEYRDVMQDYCGPAATRLVGAGRFGTFRAMETVAVVHQDSGFEISWNQIHLCELDPDGFRGFGPEFAAALGQRSTQAGDSRGPFADLDRMRTVPRWTFNAAVVEADAELAAVGTTLVPGESQ